uniref:Uncharacterized protein n=1 Tax=Nonomuraea gerenzanensis TaxID=93944 RepID=A0A1M4E945_9ACTN|nr:hypothetical protein BN4615_P4882 [Nonomuraea gerenzanensis]
MDVVETDTWHERTVGHRHPVCFGLSDEQRCPGLCHPPTGRGQCEKGR